jgi:hypothetical protein
MRGARVRPSILLTKALHVDLGGGQVRRILPLPYGRRASRASNATVATSTTGT